MEELKVEVKNRVGILTMNRPDKLNALTRGMGEAAVTTLKEWATSEEVGAVVLTGAGRGFCAGGDVSAMDRGTEIGTKESTLEQRIDSLREGQTWPWLLHTMPKVTIAVVNGPAAGAGLGLALSCDLRIASDQAQFGTAYARVGYEHALVVYDAKGRLLADYPLEGVLTAAEIAAHVTPTAGSRWWNGDAEFGFSPDGETFVIKLNWENESPSR